MNKNPCIHSCWRSSVGHDHAILESFILFVFGTYQWINKQSCVILGCHKQSSEWCHDWFPISLHVPSLSFRARFWIQSLGRHKRYTANLDGRMYGNFFFFSQGIKLPTLLLPGDGTLFSVLPKRRSSCVTGLRGFEKLWSPVETSFDCSRATVSRELFRAQR